MSSPPPTQTHAESAASAHVEPALAFTVVGIGASAGGVEALTNFFSAAPADSGMAFVVIQHLAPSTQSFMPEILGRATSMPVFLIEDGIPVKPNSVYVIRPGYTVTLVGGNLRLGEAVEKRGHRRPVDDFFRSLAAQQKEKAVVVVLSGTGTNGTAGAQAVKAVGGLCVAQDPDSAEFSGMPRSLVHSGYADEVLPPEQIAHFLVGYVQHPLIARSRSQDGTEAESELKQERPALTEIQALLRTRTGHDFRSYRKPTLLRRIQRRMGVAGVTELAQYAQMLREHSEEALALSNDLLINVTGFFRDPEAWDALRDSAIAPLVASCDSHECLRAWVGACSTGEEAYSLAMLFVEESERANKPLEVKIFATDAADRSLVLARAGVYPGGIEGDLSQERLERFFDKDEYTYRIKREIRDMVVFAPQNMLSDPPFSRVDICTCRNFLIYLEPEAQKRVLSMLSFAVADGGFLFLGSAESLGEAEQSFETLSKRWRIYRRVGSAQHRFLDVGAARFPPRGVLDRFEPAGAPGHPQPAAALSYERALLEEFGPPSVIVDRQERMLYIHGDTTPFLAYPSGQLTTSLIEAARPALRAAVRNAFRQAAETHVPVTMDSQLDPDDSTLWARVTAAPLKARSGGRNLRVSFELRARDNRGAPAGDEADPITQATTVQTDTGLEDEIRVLRRELQTSIEAFEASNEELKASNEEVLSVNEELQSANEELETSKEELQSLNEELITVNSQLQVKIQEIEHTTNDLSNLLSSTSIAVVFLDTQLLVRRFTPAVQDLIELIPTDIGRSISDLAPKFVGADGHETVHGALRSTARLVLDNLTPVETEVCSHSGRWYLQRTLPYRTADNHIEGVVLTFVDITARKLAQQSIAQIQARLQSALEQMPAAVILVDAPSGRIAHANKRAAELFGQPYPPPFLNVEWGAAVMAMRGWHPEGSIYQQPDLPLARTLASGAVIVDEQIEVLSVDGGRRALSVSSAPVRNESGEIVAAVVAFWDITRLKSVEKALRDSERRWRLIVESAQDFAIIMLDTEGIVTSWSAGAERLLGWSEAEILDRPADFFFTPADRVEKVPAREMRLALQDGRSVDERWHVRKDGTAFWANGVLSVARDEAGHLLGFVKIMRDNTEQKQIADRLYAANLEANEAQGRAEAANRAKDDFISMVSHELRTPLNTMRLWMRLLGNEALSQKDRVEGQNTLERAVLAQQQLIDDLLDISRISAGKLRIDVRLTRLAEVLSTAIESVRPVALRRNIQLTYAASPDIGVVRADPDRMQQIVWNLLSNAIKFTPSSGRVNVDLTREGDWVVIRVCDSGIGIRSEVLPRVFERFLQGQSGTAREHSGLGLGLTIVKQLVELHNGRISAASEGEGRGATFTIRLPLQSESMAATLAPLPTKEGAPDLSGVLILLVEDEPSTREGTRRLLQSSGAEVLAVESAAAGAEAYVLQPPDLVISDIGLPGEDGYVFIQQIRNLEQRQGLARVPALALTAFARDDDRQKALAAGFDAHSPKPVDPARLLIQVAELLSPRKPH